MVNQMMRWVVYPPTGKQQKGKQIDEEALWMKVKDQLENRGLIRSSNGRAED